MDPASTTTQTLGPRAAAFVEKSNAAKTNIMKAVFDAIVTDKALSPEDFVEKHITAKVQAEIAGLPDRVRVLFKNIVLDFYQTLLRNYYNDFMGLMMLSSSVKDNHAHAKFVQEKALPIVKDLVADLDTNIPGIVDEAVSSGLEQPEQQKLLGL